MSAKPTPSDFLSVQMSVMTRLIVHLDERGGADGQAFLSELLQLGRALPEGQAVVHGLFCQSLQTQIESSRGLRGAPTGERH